jgi:hypothetical protein
VRALPLLPRAQRLREARLRDERQHALAVRGVPGREPRDPRHHVPPAAHRIEDPRLGVLTAQPILGGPARLDRGAAVRGIDLAEPDQRVDPALANAARLAAIADDRQPRERERHPPARHQVVLDRQLAVLAEPPDQLREHVGMLGRTSSPRRAPPDRCGSATARAPRSRAGPAAAAADRTPRPCRRSRGSSTRAWRRRSTTSVEHRRPASRGRRDARASPCARCAAPSRPPPRRAASRGRRRAAANPRRRGYPASQSSCARYTPARRRSPAAFVRLSRTIEPDSRPDHGPGRKSGHAMRRRAVGRGARAVATTVGGESSVAREVAVRGNPLAG